MSRTLVLTFACAVLGSSLASFGAQAEGGCGIGFHRGPYGGCRPNGAAIVIAPPVVVAPAVVVAPPVVCGVGFRWHPRFRRSSCSDHSREGGSSLRRHARIRQLHGVRLPRIPRGRQQPMSRSRAVALWS
jgi:hypothetical protein